MTDFWTETHNGFSRRDVLERADELTSEHEPSLCIEASIDAAYVDCWGAIPDHRKAA